jgi:glycosyltransferase involved in cell wall biosynthesis
LEEINKPFISVIIPVYNAEKYVAKAIESALNQPEVAEVIIVNDGSKDDSLAICRAYAKKKTNIRVTHHKNNKNRGIAASRNLGVKLSNYDWVAFLDADDYYLETRFKFDAQLIKSDNTLDAVYSNSQYYNLTTKEYGEVRELKDFENPAEKQR